MRGMPSPPGRSLPFFTQKGDMIHKTLSRDSSSPINQSPLCGVYKALACGWDSGSHRSEGGQRRGTQATLQGSERTGRKRGAPGRTQDGQGEKDRPSQREGQRGKAKDLRAASRPAYESPKGGDRPHAHAQHSAPPPRPCFRLLLSASGARKPFVRPRAAASDRSRKWTQSQAEEAGGRPVSNLWWSRGAVPSCCLRADPAARRVAGPRARRHEAVQPQRPV